MSTINNNGYFEGLEARSDHYYDSVLASSLLNFFKSENVSSLADFGCGMGDYVKNFKLNNINAIGFDGNPNTPELTNNLCKVLDLSKPQMFNRPFDWVMSLEVGEHLPQQFEDIFINNLHNNNKYGIVLSWAIKGQGGHGHFNEQNNDYIKNKITNLGYYNDIESENILREKSTLHWFKNTIMVFRKKEYYSFIERKNPYYSFIGIV
jgi:cyclopropane fatty-acyl-phospholipid synthase-like methyltransferase